MKEDGIQKRTGVRMRDINKVRGKTEKEREKERERGMDGRKMAK